MTYQRSSIAPEVIAVISDGRDPTERELASVAARILREVRGRPSAFAWGGRIDDESATLIGIRLAHAALVGSPLHEAAARDPLVPRPGKAGAR